MAPKSVGFGLEPGHQPFQGRDGRSSLQAKKHNKASSVSAHSSKSRATQTIASEEKKQTHGIKHAIFPCISVDTVADLVAIRFCP